MDISLLFYSLFPDPELAGACITLSKEKGVYTLGRNSPEVTYDVNVNLNTFSRHQAALTFNYNAFTQSWEVLDAGLNINGVLASYANRCAVNGSLIPRNSKGVPDSVSIDPHGCRRILIGGDLNMRILVVADCEATLTGGGSPFEKDDWGLDLWKKVEVPSEEIRDEVDDQMTTGFTVEAIENIHLKNALVASHVAGSGFYSVGSKLADPKTRVQTLLAIILAALALGGGVSLYLFTWAVRTGRLDLMPPSTHHPQPIPQRQPQGQP